MNHTRSQTRGKKGKRSARRRPIDAGLLRRQVAAVTEILQTLNECQETIGEETAAVDGASKFERGVELLRHYTLRCRSGIDAATRYRD